MLTSGQKVLLFGVNDAEASAWRASVNAAGGSVSSATYKAVTRFVRGCKQAGIWDKLNRVNLFCGDQLTAALVPLKVGSGSATDTNVNFVSGDYTEATGITGNGTTKYLNTGLVASAVASASSCHLSFYTVGSMIMGAQGSVPDYVTLNSISSTFTQIGSNTLSASGGSGGTGFHVGSAVSSTDLRAFVNGAQTGSTQTGSRTGNLATGFSVYVAARNVSGVAANFSVGPIRGYSIGTGLTASEVAAYNTIMESFQDALGRGVQ